ncbi:hypothetical protein LX64_03266 [Chitinophaga skermanii]|uniref:Uncharacterized protein n=1 Tax=Chitinophaga skermanii TaxID=331697 RepID=A0A327QKH2_9BACT|nr:hypothetical protein [Chitinophaga skermanii]RAJ02257.1 hypothetical protein LX64_03266 [Chitinophaga skermanii]
MKHLLPFVCLLLGLQLNAQKVFKLDDFSKDYYAKIAVAECDSSGYCSGEGKVEIFSKANNKRILTQESEQLALWLHKGKAVANIKELPYGEQSVLIYEDVNFDGKKDFALCDGQNSCYGGPSFQVYLATTNGFQHSESFTRLAQDYCGMFQIDAKKKEIHTMTKSGCCWHQFSTFKVEGNEPIEWEIIEEDATTFPYAGVTIQQRVNHKMVTNAYFELVTAEAKPFFSVNLQKNNKQVVLFRQGDVLHYALLKANSDSVEFSYPFRAQGEEKDLVFSYEPFGKETTLTFTNKNATYTVYESATTVGIRVLLNGKTYDMPGNPATKKGSVNIIGQDAEGIVNVR